MHVLLVCRWIITAHIINQAHPSGVPLVSCQSADPHCTRNSHRSQVYITSHRFSLPSLDLRLHCWNALQQQSAAMSRCCSLERLERERQQQYSTWQSSCVSIPYVYSLCCLQLSNCQFAAFNSKILYHCTQIHGMVSLTSFVLPEYLSE